jgi:hypothetical protein
MGDEKKLQPKEFQEAVINALEAIQGELALVIGALRHDDGGGKIARRIVFPKVGKQCFEVERVVLTKPDPAARKPGGSSGGGPL